MTREELEIAKAACCVGTIWDEYEGKENFDHMVGLRAKHLIELVRNYYQSSLPSNLDEAAEENSKNYYCSCLENHNETGICDGCENVKLAFKAGAEWMMGQGVSFDTEMSLLDSFGFQIGWPEDTSIFDCFNEGDKVVVQIRKK